jgi:hypothetical protein
MPDILTRVCCPKFARTNRGISRQAWASEENELTDFQAILLPFVCPARGVPSPYQHSGHSRLLKPLASSEHTNLCAVVKLEVNLVHQLFHKEYAPGVVGQELLPGSRVGKLAGIEP